MAVKAEFLFDFGSPNAYLNHRVIPGIERRTGVQFSYVPVLLGGVFKATNNVSPAISMQGIRNKSEYAHLETRRFVSRHGLAEFTHNPHFPVNTLRIIRVAFEESGLPAAALIAAMDDPEVKQTLVANTEAAVARGVFGSPSFFVGGEHYFGKDRLREVEEEIIAQRR